MSAVRSATVSSFLTGPASPRDGTGSGPDTAGTGAGSGTPVAGRGIPARGSDITAVPWTVADPGAAVGSCCPYQSLRYPSGSYHSPGGSIGP